MTSNGCVMVVAAAPATRLMQNTSAASVFSDVAAAARASAVAAADACVCGCDCVGVCGTPLPLDDASAAAAAAAAAEFDRRLCNLEGRLPGIELVK